jgi:hypothetical protein
VAGRSEPGRPPGRAAHHYWGEVVLTGPPGRELPDRAHELLRQRRLLAGPGRVICDAVVIGAIQCGGSPGAIFLAGACLSYRRPRPYRRWTYAAST